MQIHGFSDASRRAIAAVVYTRTVYMNGHIDVKLTASKTKVAPVKKQTIPHLELIRVTLLARFVNSLLTTLEWNVEIFYWVDSMTIHFIGYETIEIGSNTCNIGSLVGISWNRQNKSYLLQAANSRGQD